MLQACAKVAQSDLKQYANDLSIGICGTEEGMSHKTRRPPRAPKRSVPLVLFSRGYLTSDLFTIHPWTLAMIMMRLVHLASRDNSGVLV